MTWHLYIIVIYMPPENFSYTAKTEEIWKKLSIWYTRLSPNSSTGLLWNTPDNLERRNGVMK
jgi:hypothetical protein